MRKKSTLREISSKTGISIHILRKTYQRHRRTLLGHVSRGPKNAVQLDDVGQETLLSYVRPTTPPRTNVGHDTTVGHTLADINVKILEAELGKAREKIDRLEKKVDELSADLRAERTRYDQASNRHDTIVMTLTNRLDDIQKRLPAPADTQPREDPRGLWRRFCDWMNDDPYKKSPG